MSLKVRKRGNLEADERTINFDPVQGNDWNLSQKLSSDKKIIQEHFRSLSIQLSLISLFRSSSLSLSFERISVLPGGIFLSSFVTSVVGVGDGCHLIKRGKKVEETEQKREKKNKKKTRERGRNWRRKTSSVTFCSSSHLSSSSVLFEHSIITLFFSSFSSSPSSPSYGKEEKRKNRGRERERKKDSYSFAFITMFHHLLSLKIHTWKVARKIEGRNLRRSTFRFTNVFSPYPSLSLPLSLFLFCLFYLHLFLDFVSPSVH